ncbi:terminase large subunit domain-containing protein [Sphingobium sp. LSP13-1-1.1]|uniref:terminase large subunit domain-containing protein n=1 Tax=Sphingobium sp. LSP13-1-1.1 TaxID=3135234 RepID=UPI0034401792
MSKALSEYQDLIDFLHDQTLTLGIDRYWEWVNTLPDEDREQVIATMTDPAFALQPHQFMPRLDDLTEAGLMWRYWFLRMGRGAGKTHAASTNVNLLARYVYPGLDGMLIGPTSQHVRAVMIEGESGILNTAPADFKPRYYSGTATVVWPNGSKALIYTSDDPQSIRGPSLYWAWGDELAKWKSEESFKNLDSTLRNRHPCGNRMILTTSPISSQKWVRAIEAKPETITSVATSFSNTLGLDERALQTWQRDVDQGSQRSREEYLGEWIEETDKLWTVDELDLLVQDRKGTTTLSDIIAQMDSLLLSIDPGGKRDLTGIILIGKRGDRYWILADFTNKAPERKAQWLARVAEIKREYMRDGDRILVETNVHQDADQDIQAVCPGVYVEPKQQNQHTGGKIARAQRAQLLYEDKQVVHFRSMPDLHQQMDAFYEVEASKNESPDRVDALVNGLNWYQDNKKRSFELWSVNAPVFHY